MGIRKMYNTTLDVDILNRPIFFANANKIVPDKSLRGEFRYGYQKNV
jgi:hypothetical protein